MKHHCMFNPLGVIHKVEKRDFGLFKHFVVFLIGILVFSVLPAQLILNEFMIDPDDDNTGEFIEIYNIGDSVLDLRQYLLCDEQDTDAILIFPDSLLQPKHYGLILDPDYNNEYSSLIPDSIPLFTIADSRFGMYGISNSTKKCFSVLDRDLFSIDSYQTGMPSWPDPGHSIERHSFNEYVWDESIQSGGTPGYKNSTAIRDQDLECVNLKYTLIDSIINLNFCIKNTGALDLIDYYYGYIVDISHTNTNLNDTAITKNETAIFPEDSIIVELNVKPMIKGHINIYVFAGTFDGTCDSLVENIFIPIQEDEMLVTEFVSRTGDNFTSEYIEILSRSLLPVSLRGLEIYDMTGHTSIDTNYVLCPDSMVVVVQSASFHDDFPTVNNYIVIPRWRSLNNNEDIIRLQNPTGGNVMELHYDLDWDIPADMAMMLIDTSLNYLDHMNWESDNLGSPGQPNITSTQLMQLSCELNKLFLTPLDTLKFKIDNTGYFPVGAVTCTLITELSEQVIFLPETSPGDTIICVIDTTGFFYPGTQTCTFICEPYFSKSFRYYYPLHHSPCYFNEIMFDPLDTYGQAEFIELQTITQPFDLNNWTVQVNNNVMILKDSLKNGLTVLCDKSDPLGGIPSDQKICYNGFPSLPNGGAEVYLKDPLGRIMDAVDLRDHPDLHKGKSLEKQFMSTSSSDRNIWKASVSEGGMTPSKINSNCAIPGMRLDLGIYPECFDPDNDEHIQFSIDSEQPIDFCEILCFNLAGQCIYRHEQSVFSNPSFLHFWNGKMENGEYPARGLYLVVVRILTDNDVYKLKGTFVIC